MALIKDKIVGGITMGVYGSPDLSKKYGDPDSFNGDPRRPKRTNFLLISLVMLNAILVLLGSFSLKIIYLLFTLNCIIICIYSLGSLIYNLIKRGSVMGDIRAIIISSIIFNNIISNDIFPAIIKEYNIIRENPIVGYMKKHIAIGERGTRQNPAKIGQIHRGNITGSLGLDCEIEIELLDVKKDQDALEIAKDLHVFELLEDNREYIFAKFRVKNIKNNRDEDIPLILDWEDFTYASSDYKKYDHQWASIAGGDLLMAVGLYEGAEHEAWICLCVEKDDPQPKAVYIDEVWFDL